MEENRTRFSLVLLEMHKIVLPMGSKCLDPLAQGPSNSGWTRCCLYLLVICVFMGACTLDSQTPKRVSEDTQKETLANLSRDVGVEDEKAGSGGFGSNMFGRGSTSEVGAKEIRGETQNQEIANFKINLANFKDRLASLSGAEVIEIMGPPGFERLEPPARIWQYRALDCVVNLFLYSNEGTLVVEHVDLRARGEGHDDMNYRACFESIIQKPSQNTFEFDSALDSGVRGAREPDMVGP